MSFPIGNRVYSQSRRCKEGVAAEDIRWQRVITERVDDLDGSPAVETVRFGYAGRDYEIDLNEEHAAELDELLAPYIEHGRQANGGQALAGTAIRAGAA